MEITREDVNHLVQLGLLSLVGVSEGNMKVTLAPDLLGQRSTSLYPVRGTQRILARSCRRFRSR